LQPFVVYLHLLMFSVSIACIGEVGCNILTVTVTGSGTVVSIACIGEVGCNGDKKKLTELLSISFNRLHWRGWLQPIHVD